MKKFGIYNQKVVSDTYFKSAATCDSPAVYYKSCVCGNFSAIADTFTSGTGTGHTAQHIKATEPTAAAAGNIEYWYCAKCNAYFSDAELTKEIQQKDTVCPATDTTTDPIDTDSPQTGDNSSMLLWIALLFVSGGAVLSFTVVSKVRRYKTNH